MVIAVIEQAPGIILLFGHRPRINSSCPLDFRFLNCGGERSVGSNPESSKRQMARSRTCRGAG